MPLTAAASRLGDAIVIAAVAPFAALSLFNLKRLLLGVMLLKIPLQLDTWLAYREEIAALSGLGGFNMGVMTGCLFALGLIWIFELGLGIERAPSGLLRPCWPAMLYTLVVGGSALVASDRMLAVFELNLLVQTLLLFAYLVASTRSFEDVRFVMTMLLLGLALQGVIMIALSVTGESVTIATVLMRVDEGGRVGGTIGSPNGAGAYLSTLLAPAIAVAVLWRGKALRLLALCGIALGFVALALTASRGAWLATALSITLFGLLTWRRGLVSLKAPLALGCLALLAVAPFLDSVLLRLSSDAAGSAYSRIPLMKLAMSIISQHPIFGVGANNFAFVMGSYVSLDIAGEWLNTVHNKYLLVWAETGTIGLVAFLLFLGSILSQSRRVWRGNDPLLAPLALAFGAAVTGHMLHMCVDMFNGRPNVQILWIIGAMAASIAGIDVSKRMASQPIASSEVNPR